MAQSYPLKPIPAEPNGAALTGFILSLIGLFLCVPLIFVALGFCFVGLKREPKGLAVAGTFICLAAFILWTVVAILSFTIFAVPMIACMGFASAVYDEIELELQNEFKDHPDVVRELGGIDSVSVSLNEAGEYKQGNETTMVYRVRGPRGEGKLVIATQYDDGGERITTRLVVDDQTWELKSELRSNQLDDWEDDWDDPDW